VRIALAIALAVCAMVIGSPTAQAQRIIFPTPIEGAADPLAAPAPLASPQGMVQPNLPPATFDPYTPGMQPVYPSTPYGPTPPGAVNANPLTQPQRLLQQLRFENEYLPKFDSQGLGINSLELNASFAIPAPFMPKQPPVFVTPGFAAHWLNGPESDQFSQSPDLPARIYDAYLDTGWRPVATPWLSGDIGFRVGVFSDFNFVTNHSIRLMGRGLGIITLSPAWQLAMGVVYLDRNVVKILPAGGLIWTPNPDVRWEILFPRPKLANRLTTMRNTDLWFYVAAEYGGGAWTIRRANGEGDWVDINDYRIYLGLETKGISRLRGWLEVGIVFGRQIRYALTNDPPNADPSTTMMLRSGLAY
jgi:hypothetical protein